MVCQPNENGKKLSAVLSTDRVVRLHRAWPGMALGVRGRWRKEWWEVVTVANVAGAPSGRRWREPVELGSSGSREHNELAVCRWRTAHVFRW